MGKILVVDDDPDMQKLILTALQADGHAVVQALDPAEGLALLASEPVDVVITDFMMPKMNGVEFLERLHLDHRDQKCIMITGYGTTDAIVGALREQVCDFLPKPFTIAELRGAVSSALAASSTPEIEVVSARPEWIELRVPCRLSAVPLVQRLLLQLKGDLPQGTRDSIALAFREMLNNAIEYGGKLDPNAGSANAGANPAAASNAFCSRSGTSSTAPRRRTMSRLGRALPVSRKLI